MAGCEAVATEAIWSVWAAARAPSEGERVVVRLFAARFDADEAVDLLSAAVFAGAIGV